MAQSSQLIKFGLDVLFEQTDIGGAGDFEVVIEEVELCTLPSLPDSFNGPGYLHPLGGNALQLTNKYKMNELLEGTALKFKLHEPSLVSFYLEVPEGLKAEASIQRLQGTRNIVVKTTDLNRDDETFLRQD